MLIVGKVRNVFFTILDKAVGGKFGGWKLIQGIALDALLN